MGPHAMKVAVIGLGYVGIPVAALLASKGVRAIGIDIDRRKVEAVAAGRSPLEGDEPGLEDLKEHLAHRLVVVLSCVDQDLLVVAAHLAAHGRRLHELGPRADDARDSHPVRDTAPA